MAFGELVNTHETLKEIVTDIRRLLEKDYDIEDQYQDYSGLCDEAYTRFKAAIESFNIQYGTNWEVLHFHGEQKHSAQISPSNWIYQHTWMGVKIDEKVVYVDPTSQQFRWLHKDIPDYYISSEPPPWYYWDRKNPAFNSIWKRLNELIKWKRIVKDFDGEYHRVTEHLVEFIQYSIWGGLCELYRKYKRIPIESPPDTVYDLKAKLMRTVKDLLIVKGVPDERLYPSGESSPQDNFNQLIGDSIDAMLTSIDEKRINYFFDEMKKLGIKKLIDESAAYCVKSLSDKSPGLFFMIQYRDNKPVLFTGIDNRDGSGGVPWELFTDMEKCRTWLLSKKAEEVGE